MSTYNFGQVNRTLKFGLLVDCFVELFLKLLLLLVKGFEKFKGLLRNELLSYLKKSDKKYIRLR